MIKCPFCDGEVDEDDVKYDCPFCGEMDYGEGFYKCEDCETLFDREGDLWFCEYCNNEGKKEPEPRRIEYYDYDEDDEYCEDGIPDVNQGWVGEHYG